MDSYVFYDEYDNEEFDIAGEDYVNLLKTCFKYCSSFSFVIRGHNREVIKENLSHEFENFRIPVDENVIKAYLHYYSLSRPSRVDDEVFCYKTCPETFKHIMDVTDSIFKWIDAWGYINPEDLAFFREDGSIFFNSTVHEGECYLYPRPEEDVRDILSIEKWFKRTKNVSHFDTSK